VDRDAPEESIPSLLAALHARSGAPINRAIAAADLGYHSRQSFDLRLVKLVRTFGAIWCHQVGQTGRRVTGAQAKLYLSDPIMAWLGPRLRAGLPAPDLTRLTESSLATLLAVAIESRQPGRWTTAETVGYLRARGGGEIDFAPAPLPSPNGEVHTPPIEVKWVSHGWRAEARPLVTAFGRGIVATKNVTDTTGPVWALPAPLLASSSNDWAVSRPSERRQWDRGTVRR
jgi:hypothetical protein